mmetsp:Transcript_37402/g.115517  ORF Transcript_37402/g.115517 Transcript_37402/m.115517 type:complete len:390 (+) Transcript_37402:91-1260(+)
MGGARGSCTTLNRFGGSKFFRSAPRSELFIVALCRRTTLTRRPHVLHRVSAARAAAGADGLGRRRPGAHAEARAGELVLAADATSAVAVARLPGWCWGDAGWRGRLRGVVPPVAPGGARDRARDVADGVDRRDDAAGDLLRVLLHEQALAHVDGQAGQIGGIGEGLLQALQHAVDRGKVRWGTVVQRRRLRDRTRAHGWNVEKRRVGSRGIRRDDAERLRLPRQRRRGARLPQQRRSSVHLKRLPGASVERAAVRCPTTRRRRSVVARHVRSLLVRARHAARAGEPAEEPVAFVPGPPRRERAGSHLAHRRVEGDLRQRAVAVELHDHSGRGDRRVTLLHVIEPIRHERCVNAEPQQTGQVEHAAVLHRVLIRFQEGRAQHCGVTAGPR